MEGGNLMSDPGRGDGPFAPDPRAQAAEAAVPGNRPRADTVALGQFCAAPTEPQPRGARAQQPVSP